MYKWSVREKSSRKRWIHFWGLTGSSDTATQPVPRFPSRCSCWAINLWLNLSADRIGTRCPVLSHYCIVCLWTALTIKPPFLSETEICLPVVLTSGTSWGGGSAGRQLGLVERMWDLELEGLGANATSDTRQWWTVCFSWKNRWWILPQKTGLIPLWEDRSRQMGLTSQPGPLLDRPSVFHRLFLAWCSGSCLVTLLWVGSCSSVSLLRCEVGRADHSINMPAEVWALQPRTCRTGCLLGINFVLCALWPW